MTISIHFIHIHHLWFAGSAVILHSLANSPDICNNELIPSAILMCV